MNSTNAIITSNTSSSISLSLNRSSTSTTSFADFVPYISLVVYGLISIVGVLGNGIVIIVYAFNRTMRDSTNTLIINLAAADLMFVALCVPFTAVLYWGVWPFPSFWCSLVSYLQYVSAYASVWTLALLAFDRFLAVAQPMKSKRWRSVQNTRRVCVVLWLVVGVGNAPTLTVFRRHEYEYGGVVHSTCMYVEHFSRRADPMEIWAVYGGFVMGAYLLPLVIITLLYLSMVWKLWNSGTATTSLPTTATLSVPGHSVRPNANVGTERYKRKVTRMIGVVSVTFALCWLPQNVRFVSLAAIYPGTPSYSEWQFVLQLLAQVLAYGNSCMNPILYGLMSANFQKAYANFLRVLAGRPPKYQLRRGTQCVIETQAGGSSNVAKVSVSNSAKLSTTLNDRITGGRAQNSPIAARIRRQMRQRTSDSPTNGGVAIGRVSLPDTTVIGGGTVSSPERLPMIIGENNMVALVTDEVGMLPMPKNSLLTARNRRYRPSLPAVLQKDAGLE